MEQASLPAQCLMLHEGHLSALGSFILTRKGWQEVVKLIHSGSECLARYVIDTAFQHHEPLIGMMGHSV